MENDKKNRELETVSLQEFRELEHDFADEVKENNELKQQIAGLKAQLSVEELKQVCALTVKLTELRQRDCPHLCIENFAPEVFAKLCAAYAEPFNFEGVPLDKPTLDFIDRITHSNEPNKD